MGLNCIHQSPYHPFPSCESSLVCSHEYSRHLSVLTCLGANARQPALVDFRPQGSTYTRATGAVARSPVMTSFKQSFSHPSYQHPSACFATDPITRLIETQKLVRHIRAKHDRRLVTHRRPQQANNKSYDLLRQKVKDNSGHKKAHQFSANKRHELFVAHLCSA